MDRLKSIRTFFQERNRIFYVTKRKPYPIEDKIHNLKGGNIKATKSQPVLSNLKFAEEHNFTGRIPKKHS